MKNYFILFFLVLVALSCSRRGGEIVPTSYAEVSIRGQTYKFRDAQIANENCDDIFITISAATYKDFPYHLHFQLSKQGEIKKIDFADFKDQNKNYKSPYFNPKDYIKIANFQYDTLQSTLSFDYEAKLFIPHKLLDNTIIKGSMSNLNIKKTTCETNISYLYADLILNNTNLNRFYASIISSTSTTTQTDNNYYFYSNTGLRLLINSPNPLYSLPIGVYNIINNSSDKISIRFDQYLGLTNANYFYLYEPKEWQPYRVDGTIEILDKRKVDITYHRVIGKISLKIYNNNNIQVGSLENGRFASHSP